MCTVSWKMKPLLLPHLEALETKGFADVSVVLDASVVVAAQAFRAAK